MSRIAEARVRRGEELCEGLGVVNDCRVRI